MLMLYTVHSRAITEEGTRRLSLMTLAKYILHLAYMPIVGCVSVNETS